MLSAPSFWSEVTVSPGPVVAGTVARWHHCYTRHMATPHATTGGKSYQCVTIDNVLSGPPMGSPSPLSVLQLATLVECPLPRLQSSSPGHTLLVTPDGSQQCEFYPAIHHWFAHCKTPILFSYLFTRGVVASIYWMISIWSVIYGFYCLLTDKSLSLGCRPAAVM